jgi:hypothetical protein
MKGLAVSRLTLEVSVYDHADEAAHRQDEHHRGRHQRNRHNRPPNLPFARLLQESYPFKLAGIREILSIGRDDRLSGTDGRESLAAPDDSWVWASHFGGGFFNSNIRRQIGQYEFNRLPAYPTRREGDRGRGKGGLSVAR